MGFSRGRWEGDTLVIETVGGDPRTWIDGHGGHQHSDKMKLTERLVRTVWIIDSGREAPRLVTAYPGKE